MVQIGYKHDRHGNQLYDKTGKPIPIYKEAKKVIIQHVDGNNTVRMKKVKSEWNGQSWMIKAFDKLFIIHKDSIFWDKHLNFYVLTIKPLD